MCNKDNARSHYDIMHQCREHSPLGEVSLYGWIKLVNDIQKQLIFFVVQVQSC